MRRQLQPSGVDRIAVSPEQLDNPTLKIGFDFAGTSGKPPQIQRSARGAGDTPPEQLSTIRRFYECPDVAFLSIAEVFDRFHTHVALTVYAIDQYVSQFTEGVGDLFLLCRM